jgi:solute carrier family 25 phosphate transporter 23/24/25/41
MIVVRSEEHKLRDAFRAYDTDGSGYIEHNELVAALRNYANWDVSHEQAAALLSRLDYDRDGRLSFKEFRRMLILLGDPDVRKVALFWARLGGVDDGGDIPPLIPPPPPPQAVARLLDAKASSTTLTKSSQDFIATSKQFVAGGLAGAISRSVVSPLERLKIMLVDHHISYHTIPYHDAICIFMVDMKWQQTQS